MELSPKQQTVELIKKASRVLVIGHKNPNGDCIGSVLAMQKALTSLDKSVELIISDKIPETYKFLPNLQEVKESLLFTEGKILRIDTKRFPLAGMSVKNTDDAVDIILDSKKNLKFEFLEIINGMPKPDVVLVLDTPDVEKIDAIYDKNTELFFEVPIINIDHHPGNEYFGTVNMVDLTASSTAEILVSLFEALGIKISDPDTATCLLTGIISDTQSFRSQTTTPKSLTVAAQLLAAGGRQQEIISNLYKQKPIALMKLWGDLIAGIKEDKAHNFAWTKVALSDVADKTITAEDVSEAADELLTNTPDAEIVLVLCETTKGNVFGKLKSRKGIEIASLAAALGGEGSAQSATFTETGKDLDEVELKVIKKIHDFWAEKGEIEEKNVFDVMGISENETVRSAKLDIKMNPREDESFRPEVQEEIKGTSELSLPKTKEEIRETAASKKEDVIETALESIEKEHKMDVPFATIGEVIQKKKREYLKDEEIDVFDESNGDDRISEMRI